MLQKIREILAQTLEKELDQSREKFLTLLNIPKQYEHGHLSLPLFSFAKECKENPQKLGQNLAAKLKQQDLSFFIEKVEGLGGFLNFHFQPAYLQKVLFQSLKEASLEKESASEEAGKTPLRTTRKKREGEHEEPREHKEHKEHREHREHREYKGLRHSNRLGHSNIGQGKTMIIDYASPNIAKPMNIGHFRATIIGQALKNLGETQGFKTLGVNHLGDWGTQFGKLAWAFEQWSQDVPLEEKPMESLLQLYTRFHKEAEARPELEVLGAKQFKLLEKGDKKIVALWKKLVDLSLKDYQALWDFLGVKHDLVQGESFYNPLLPDLLKRLTSKGLLKESLGAKVVFLDEGLPPCLIEKSDGASIYAARDLACAIYRREKLQADINLYVVGVDQELHFKQIFQVLKKMGYAWAKSCHHIAFGMYRFKDKRMSTRKGQVVLFSEVVEQAIERAKKVLQERDLRLEGKQEEKVARQVGLGALIFNDLVNDRIRNVDFDWDQVLDFRGDNGPYVQYTHVRCLSVLEKLTGQRKPLEEQNFDSLSPLQEDLEKRLIFHLLQFEETLTKAFSLYRPHILAGYLLDLCHLFSQFYQKHSILKAKDASLKRGRVALVGATQRILQKGMEVLHLPIPKVM